MPAPDLADRFAGCLLGLACGDAFAAPFEGVPDWFIFAEHGLPERFMQFPLNDPMRYTDDTEMMIGVAETLVELGHIDADHLLGRFAANFTIDRGYGGGARKILTAAKAGENWNRIAETNFPGGSLGNGGAMRVAPVGLLFHHDLDRVWEESGKSAWPTHRHPVGIEAAQVMALAVAVAVRSTGVERRPFLHQLRGRVRTEEMTWALDTAIGLRKGDQYSVLGSTLQAHRSVVTAIALFAAERGDYLKAVGRCVALGDDTDTLAAMAGALCGALGGTAAVPDSMLDKLEDDERGRTHIRRLAEKLHQRWSSGQFD
jgi:poly(ADP-ribose) glycohydrolase ARH3